MRVEIKVNKIIEIIKSVMGVLHKKGGTVVQGTEQERNNNNNIITIYKYNYNYNYYLLTYLLLILTTHIY